MQIRVAIESRRKRCRSNAYAPVAGTLSMDGVHSILTQMDDRLPFELPVASVLPQIVAASRSGAVVVSAPAGSGKTMLVPAAILDDLPSNQGVVLIQPRRLAARAVARWISQLRGR
jgi:HrpA-like RNA helicase